MFEYYSSQKVTDCITAIRSMSGEILYLITGSDSSILIDTCVGIKGLRSLVESLTDKPVSVLLSHGHVDHALGAPEFDVVYMNEKDIPLYKSMCPFEERRGYITGGIGPERAALVKEEDFVESVPEQKFLNLEDGMSFDLGGVTVETVAFPGHTAGCMAFLIVEERILIVGDACNNATFLFDDNALTLSDYENSVKRVKECMDGKYDRVFIMHHEMEANKEILEEMIELCDEIKAEKADDIPFEFMGNKAYIAKVCNERFQREDGKFANLIYNKQKL